MSLEEIFKNLTSEEFEQARQWFDHLREPEKPRIINTLNFLNNREFYLEENLGKVKKRFAFVVAGTSIDTDNYTDIDIMMLPEKTLYTDEMENYRRQNPKSALKEQLKRQLPDLVEYIIYNVTHAHMSKKYIVENRQLGIEHGLGATVEISLFYEMSDRRKDHSDDLVEPKQPIGAESIIDYNREQGSKFLVLSRQYEPANFDL